MHYCMIESLRLSSRSLSYYELLMLTASSNNTAKMTSLVVISDLLDCISLLPFEFAQHRNDCILQSCYFSFNDDENPERCMASMIVGCFLRNWLIYIIDWMIEWLNDWMIEWLNNWMIEWFMKLNDWMIEWLNDWMIEWLNDWMIEWFKKWLNDLKNDWMI